MFVSCYWFDQMFDLCVVLCHVFRHVSASKGVQESVCGCIEVVAVCVCVLEGLWLSAMWILSMCHSREYLCERDLVGGGGLIA